MNGNDFGVIQKNWCYSEKYYFCAWKQMVESTRAKYHEMFLKQQ